MTTLSRKRLAWRDRTIGVLFLTLIGIASSHAQSYLIDPTHANVRFAIDHFNTSTNTGGFYNLTGQVDYNPDAKTGSVSLLIPINTLNTGNKAFDITLKSKDFFDVDKYPLAYFKSTQWHFTEGAKPKVARVDGLLALRDKTHPVTLLATKFNCYFSPVLKKQACGGDFTTTIDRRKWDIDKYTLLGMTEKVELNIQIEATKQ